MEKSCSNCQDLIVCFGKTGEEPTQICSDWQLDLNSWSELFTHEEIFKMTKKQMEAKINQYYKDPQN